MTIGGDFEFEIYDNIIENVIDASLLIKSSSGEIGLDGFTSIGEIRPPYDHSPSGFFNNIINSLSKLKRKINIMFMYPTFDSICYPTGFHIHLGIPSHFNSNRIGTLLSDIYYDTVYKYNSEKRKSFFYSNRGNYKLKKYGVEYRECPSTVLNEPEYFRIFLNSIYRFVQKKLDKGDIDVSKNDIPKKSDGLIDVSDEQTIKQIFNFNDYEISVFKNFVFGNYEKLKGVISPLVVKFVIGKLTGKYKGKWNKLKIYIIENVLEKFTDINLVKNSIEIEKTVEVEKKPKINKNKKIKIYLDKSLAESKLDNWENDKNKWMRFIESLEKMRVFKEDSNMVYYYIESFY